MRITYLLCALVLVWFGSARAQAVAGGVYNLELSVFPVTTGGFREGELSMEYGWRSGVGRGRLTGIGFFELKKKYGC